jgi:tol-pal system protein YbgF
MIKKIIAVSVLNLVAFSAVADVPVVDYSSDARSSAKSFAVNPEPEFVPASVPAISTSGLSADQRINKLEQQVNNISEQNSATKVDSLQQQFQKLTGQIEDQKHQIEQLNSQLRSFYQDLNQRLEKPGSEKSGLEKPKIGESAVVDATVSKSTSDTSTAPVTTGEVIEAASSSTAVAAIDNRKNDEIKPRTDKAFLAEQQMYQTAIDLLPDKKYEASGNKLHDYLKHYPKGAYVANAHYWLGEINFLQKNYDAAEEEFKIVTVKYPKSKRISDAMFKLALTHQNQGRDAQAKQELKQVMKRYPGTSAAQLAKLQLEGN